MAEPEDQSAGPRRSPAPDLQAADRCVEWCPICRTADVLRESAPPELRDQWYRVQREALLTMRTVIDHYFERLNGAEPERARVVDIPID